MGIFFIHNELKDVKFEAEISIDDNNFTYLEVQNPHNYRHVHNLFAEDYGFTVYGTLDDNKSVIILNTQGKLQDENTFLIRGDTSFVGDGSYYNNEKINEVSAVYSGFKTVLDNYDKSAAQKFNDDTMYFYQNPKDRKDDIAGIRIVFCENKDFEEVLYIINTINIFFTILHNYPSTISKLKIKTVEDKRFDVNINWLPTSSRNYINSITSSRLGLNNLSQKLSEWIDFSNKSQIAMQQYFALTTLNKNYYEQMILYTSIFAFDGFLSKHYNKKGNFRTKLTDFFERHKLYFEKNLIELFVSQNQFIDQIVNFRNTYAHNTDEHIAKVKTMKQLLPYSDIINKAIRILLLKDVLGLNDLVI